MLNCRGKEADTAAAVIAERAKQKGIAEAGKTPEVRCVAFHFPWTGTRHLIVAKRELEQPGI